jgi:hypothetical protein
MVEEANGVIRVYNANQNTNVAVNSNVNNTGNQNTNLDNENINDEVVYTVTKDSKSGDNLYINNKQKLTLIFPKEWTISENLTPFRPFIYEGSDFSFAVQMEAIDSFTNEGTPYLNKTNITDEQNYIAGGPIPTFFGSNSSTKVTQNRQLLETATGLRGYISSGCTSPNGPSFGKGFVTFTKTQRVVFNYTDYSSVISDVMSEGKGLATACNEFIKTDSYKQRYQEFQEILATIELK